MIIERGETRFWYRAWDMDGNYVPFYIIKVSIDGDDEKSNALKKIVGVNYYPVIAILLDEKKDIYFNIPFYDGKTIINLIDYLDKICLHFPYIVKNDDCDKIKKDADNFNKNIGFIDNVILLGKSLNNKNTFMLVTFDYESDPHINVSTLSLHLTIGNGDIIKKGENKGEYKFDNVIKEVRLTNLWLFYIDLKHYDPRFGFDKDTMDLSFK